MPPYTLAPQFTGCLLPCVLFFVFVIHLQELDRLELKADLYERLGTEEDLGKAEQVLQDLLERSPDQWSYYVSLIDLAGRRHGQSLCGAFDV